ncbi:MAG: acyl-CoA dehydrogenase family protein [Candidatus Thermoplasmatota archaeon]|nr:acyl-CoA dehydrogenase family protein [Candidatus Thermoplasmatota archaeon]
MVQDESSETYEILRNTVREFVSKKIAPIAAKIDERDEFPLAIFKEMGKLGLLGITVPEEFGGSGMDYLAQGIVTEELAYGSASFALSYAAHSNLCLDNLYRNGSEEIREVFVPKLCSGEWIGSLAMTEPGSGTDALAMKSQVVMENGRYYLSGSKTLITNAPYSDLFLTYAKTGGGYSAFAVLSTDKGFSRGEKFSKMGMRGSPTGTIFFDKIELDTPRILGKIGDGKQIMLSGLNYERIVVSFLLIGIARKAFDLSMKYSLERKQSNRYLYEFQLIEEKLAYMYVKYTTSRLLLERALKKVLVNPLDSLAAASAVLHASESAEYIARESIQIHGGYGYVKDSGVERLLRDAVLGQIGAGTTEIRKHIISSALIKSYKRDGVIPL